MKKIITAILAAIILMIWGMISWVGLSWHEPTLKKFSDEKAVSTIINSNARQSGIYVIAPNYTAPPANSTAVQTPTPLIFAAVSPQAPTNMAKERIDNFITDFIAALLVIFMLAQSKIRGYGGRLGFIILFAIAAGFVSHVPYSIWWHFPLGYTLVAMADLIIGWFLAGLVIAALIKPRREV